MRECAQVRTIRVVSLMAAASICVWAGDAQRGSLVARRVGCLECHAVGGHGVGHETPSGTMAPNLSENLMPTYTPSALASTLGNNTPAMWRETAGRNVDSPVATAEEWEDVFARLYSLQFSETRRGQARQIRVRK